MPDIFLSYRRSDSGAVANRIYDQLAIFFGADNIFRIEDVSRGENFVLTLERAIRKCKVMIVLIGQDWLEAREVQGSGQLWVPTDLVRRPVEKALQRDIAIIPILLDGAVMPNQDDLPQPLRPLIDYQSAIIRSGEPTFRYDMRRLVQSLEKVLEESAAARFIFENSLAEAGTGILRVYAHGEVLVNDVRLLLSAVENAYNCCYILFHLIEEVSSENFSSAINAVTEELFMSNTTPLLSAGFVPQGQRLTIKGVILQSPGFWDFVGNLNPLQILLTYLNERHERQKDHDYRNAAESHKLELENRLLETKLISQQIDILQQLGATPYEIDILKSQLLAQPLRALGNSQDKRLLSEAGLVDRHGNVSNKSIQNYRDFRY